MALTEANGRFSKPRNSCEIDLPEGSLSLDGTIVVKKSPQGFDILTTDSLSNVFDVDLDNDKRSLAARLQTIANLLFEKRISEAVFLATFTAWPLKARRNIRADVDFPKYNFNPEEPRNTYGRWTRDTWNLGDPELIYDVAYPGTYHDQLLSDAVDFLRRKGSSVVTEIRLTGINGVTARADAIVRPAGGEPYVMEVKTGTNPPFTLQQDAVYPLICTGPHAISPDAKISQVGYSAGDLLPQMNVWIVYSRGPGQKPIYFNGCKIPAIWKH